MPNDQRRRRRAESKPSAPGGPHTGVQTGAVGPSLPTRRARASSGRLAILADAAGALFASLSVSDVFQAVGELASRVLPADAHGVWHWEETDPVWRLAWKRGLSPGFAVEITRWVGAPASALPTAPLAIEDVTRAPLLAERQERYADEGIKSLLTIPLRMGDRSCGTVVAYYRRTVTHTPADLRVATAVGNLGSSALTTALLYDEQLRSRQAAERAEDRARFLAAATSALSSSLDYEQTLATVARLAVPEIADWCSVEILGDDGAIKRVAVAHVDPAKIELARRFQERYPEDPASPFGVQEVLRTATPVMMSNIPDELLAAAARDPEHLEMLRQLELTSYMRVPLIAQGRATGVLTFVSAESRKPYTEADLRFAEDVASRAALAVENARAYREARRANELKDDFLATLSHELRTPLNAILGYTRMLRGGFMSPDRRDQALLIVERNAIALNQIVEDVLDVSRIVAGKIRLNVQAVDLPRVVEDAVATLVPAADAKGLRLQTVIDPAASPVSGDPDRLQQVVWNLISNAVKFTPRGGRVQVRLERVNSHVEIVVSDTGIGIASEFLPHVFERFRQADSRFTREHSGLGLGLAIVRRMVELHGGVVTVASAGEGQGATFRVKLPSMIVHPERYAEQTRFHPRAMAPGEVGPLPTLEGVHVLAIDDEEDALRLVSDILEAAGARVTARASAQRALEALDSETPDVVVTDIGMPEMDGCEFMTRLRRSADRAKQEIPAAALTAYARSEDRIRVLRSGFQMHLAKPIDPAELVAAIGALAGRRHRPPTTPTSPAPDDTGHIGER